MKNGFEKKAGKVIFETNYLLIMNVNYLRS